MKHSSLLLLGLSLLAFALAAIGTGVVRRCALAYDVLDVPNHRSSHKVPTPRGGGIAIILAVLLTLSLLAFTGSMDAKLFVALAGGGIAVAIVGFVDDQRGLSARTRLIVHAGAALWALAWLDDVPMLRLADHVVSLGGWGYILGALGIIWTLNLFNFMDGIDGIAATEGAFITCGAVLVALISGVPVVTPSVALPLGAACCGFLLWNWPPAKIFMGDVCSGFLGFMIAVLAFAAARDDGTTLWVWLILGGAFFVDATVTLICRLLRGESIHQAHRSHAYQILARRWASHGRVTIAVLLINVTWLLSCALLAALYPSAAAWMLLLALAPIVVAVLIVGSGRRENE